MTRGDLLGLLHLAVIMDIENHLLCNKSFHLLPHQYLLCCCSCLAGGESLRKRLRWCGMRQYTPTPTPFSNLLIEVVVVLHRHNSRLQQHRVFPIGS